MTVCGVALLSPDHAVLWTDAEHWLDDRVHYRAPKAVVNTHLCAAGCGAGAMQILSGAEQVIREARDTHRLPEKITKALRDGLQAYATRHAGTRSAWATRVETYFAAWFDPSMGRVIAWEFDYSRFFEPIVQTLGMAPWVQQAPMWKPASPHEIVEAARKQMVQMRATDPQSGATGPLTVLEIAKDTVIVRGFADFDADPRTRADAAPPEMTDDAAVAAQTENGEMQDVY